MLMHKLRDCSPDKQADIAFRLAEKHQRQLFWQTVGDRLETGFTTAIVVSTLFILVHPGANQATTQWFQNIGWLHVSAPQLGQESQQQAAIPTNRPEQQFNAEANRLVQSGDVIQGFEVGEVRYLRAVHPVSGQRNVPHEGVDVKTPVGVPVKLPLAGTVECQQDGIWGTYAIVRFPEVQKQYFLLHHLSECRSSSEPLPQGTEFGKTGTAGTGPHLHFEKWELVNGDWKDFNGSIKTVNNEWKPVDPEVGWIEAFLTGRLPIGGRGK